MLSDADIQVKIGSKDISISNFEEDSLTPVGYDLRVGGRGFSWTKLEEISVGKGNPLKIEPNDTVVIETYESVRLSKDISGTLHAMATLTLRRGLSHISTTVDPGWAGKLLVSLHNNLSIPVELNYKDPFCTICLYQVQSAALKEVGRSPNRKDIWDELIDKAREVKDRQEKKKKREDEEQNRQKIRFLIWRVFIFLLVLGVGVTGSLWLEPQQATFLIATLTAAVVLLPDILKP